MFWAIARHAPGTPVEVTVEEYEEDLQSDQMATVVGPYASYDEARKAADELEAAFRARGTQCP